MKKFLKLSIFILIAMILFLPNVYAGTAKVKKLSAEATVNLDGSMTIKETINWNIEDSLNGVYRDILYGSNNKLNSANKIEVLSVMVNNKTYGYSKEKLENGNEGLYNLNLIKNGIQVKIFSPSKNENKTTVITYKLEDVVVQYNDVTELYWNFIGDGWNYGIDNVDITITIPKGSKMLKVFGHGPLKGNCQVVDDKTVKLTVDGLRSNEQVDARVLMDNGIVSVKKSVNENALESILEDEARLADEANRKREVAKILLYVAVVVAFVSVVCPIIIYIKFKKELPEAQFDGKYYRQLPEDYGPCVMNKVLYPISGIVSSQDMLATLLDLVRKKYVKIEAIYKDGDKTKKVKDHKLILINEDLSELSEVERYFITDMIFTKGNEITLKQLNKENTKSYEAQNEAFAAYTKWKKIINDKAQTDGVIKENKKGTGSVIVKCLICLFLTFVIFMIGCMNNYVDIMIIGGMAIFINIFEFVIVTISVSNLNARTQKGIEHEKMWKAFKKFLLDFSKLDEKGYEALALWEHYLVYAAGLGIADKVINQLKIVYPTEFNNDDMLNNYIIFSMLSNNSSFGTFSSFESAFTTASSAAFSSPSSSTGSGGGFSGGAGGGGGGGGGGGF